jgi:hypothetical protein
MGWNNSTGVFWINTGNPAHLHCGEGYHEKYMKNIQTRNLFPGSNDPFQNPPNLSHGYWCYEKDSIKMITGSWPDVR